MSNSVTTITEGPRETPVLDRVDVLVAGGGPAGIAAALAAAREGARTALVERYGYLGGMITGGSSGCWLLALEQSGQQSTS